jgi:hypothetical protein
MHRLQDGNARLTRAHSPPGAGGPQAPSLAPGREVPRAGRPHEGQRVPCLTRRLERLMGPGRGRCVSIFLDKNRRHTGESQSKRPAKKDATAAAPSLDLRQQVPS